MNITFDLPEIFLYKGSMPVFRSQKFTSQKTYEVSDDFIRDFKFYLCGAEQTNFTTLLIQLMFKADNSNLVKLSSAFPEEALTIYMYKNIEDFAERIVGD